MKKLALTAVALLSLVTSAYADNITFRVESNHPNTVQVKFYSQSYNRVWPGSSTAWDIADWNTHTYNLSCDFGEEIAWGAWVKGNPSLYWGIGDGDQGCDDCVYTCGIDTPNTQVLNP